MSERETLLLLDDIRTSIINILEFTKGMTLEIYESDLKTRFAVEINFLPQIVMIENYRSGLL